MTPTTPQDRLDAAYAAYESHLADCTQGCAWRGGEVCDAGRPLLDAYTAAWREANAI